MKKILIASIFTASVIGCASAPFIGSFNFKQLAPGVYRSGQPKTLSDFQTLTNNGVNRIVKLNTEDLDLELKLAAQVGITVTNIPISLWEQFFGVSESKMNSALANVMPGTDIHCKNGWDRTGLLCGMFAVEVLHWNKSTAYNYMLTNGFHPSLFGLKAYWDFHVFDTNAAPAPKASPQQAALVTMASTQSGVLLQWDADTNMPLANQNFHIYSSTNGPYKTIPWLDPRYTFQVVDTNKLMQFTNWREVAVVKGFNGFFWPMTNQQRFFAVRAEAKGIFSGWATSKKTKP